MVKENSQDIKLKYQYLIGNLTKGIAVFNMQGEILIVNDAIRELWGLSKNTFNRLKIEYNLFEDTYLEELGFLKPLKRKIKKGWMMQRKRVPFDSSKMVSQFTEIKEGRKGWQNIKMYTLELEDSTFEIVLIAEDLTDLVSSQEDLKKAMNDVLVLKQKIERENIYLKEEIERVNVDEVLVFASNEMADVISQVQMVASTGASVLLQGETGTGKEVIARAIHNASNRKNKHMVKVNCGAIPSELIESELFGHKKGAFTDAIKDRIGKFELADGGTLFLDEIGELPLELQPKLLRVLQEGEIQAVGSSEVQKIDVRIIAATNRNLKSEVQNNTFREDLYFRLNVFPIEIPALRNRRDDIPVLINHFVVKYSKKHNKTIKHILNTDLKTLQSNHWPGNVRELENIIERSVIISYKDHLIFDLSNQISDDGQKRQLDQIGRTLDEVQYNHILKTLESTNWRISGPNGAAIILGINPSTLRDRIKKLGLTKHSKA